MNVTVNDTTYTDTDLWLQRDPPHRNWFFLELEQELYALSTMIHINHNLLLRVTDLAD